MNLANQLSGVGQNNNLYFFDGLVDLHQAGHCVGTSLATTVDCLEQEVCVGLVQDSWDGDRLDDRWLLISK